MPTTPPGAAVDTNDLLMRYTPEAIWGTIAVGPVSTLRLDSEGFSSSKSRIRPNEIDPSGQASKALTTKQEATGALNFSVSPSFELLELLASSIGTRVGGSSWAVTAVGSLSNTTTRIATVTGSATTWATAGASQLFPGQYVRVSSGANNFIGKISATGFSNTVINLTECTGHYGNWASSSTIIESIGSFYAGLGSFLSISNVIGDTCSIVFTGALFNTAGSSSEIIVGQYIKVVSGDNITGAGNFIGRVCQVISDTMLNLDCLSVTLFDQAPVGGSTPFATTIRGVCLRNGTSVTTYSVEKRLASNLFLLYSGSFPTGGSLDVGVGDYLKGTLSFLCEGEHSYTTTNLAGTVNPAPTGLVIDPINGIGPVWKGLATPGVIYSTPIKIAGTVQKLGVKWSKEGAASQFGIGSALSLGIRSGKILATGSLSMYFKDFTMYDHFKNTDNGSISFLALETVGITMIYAISQSPTSKGFSFTFCNATIMNPKIVAGGPGQDVMADFEIEGNPDITSPSIFGGKTLQIDYFV